MSAPINVFIHGLGKVGRAVRAAAAADARVNVVGTIDIAAPDATARAPDAALLARADAVIDFSRGDAVWPLVETVARERKAVRVVTGTSGWDADEGRIRAAVRDAGLYFLYGANFSLGTAVFMRLAEIAADLFGRAGGFDVAVLDVHHRHKADMPSGTARKIAAGILARFPGKTEALYGAGAGPVSPHQVHVASLRVGENKGFHEVRFDADGEVVTLSQQTRDRGAYGVGALAALKWLTRQKEPGYYTFDDVLEETVYGKG